MEEPWEEEGSGSEGFLAGVIRHFNGIILLFELLIKRRRRRGVVCEWVSEREKLRERKKENKSVRVEDLGSW